MTVAELMFKLQGLPHDARVVVSGYEGGVGDVANVSEVMIKLNVNDEWYYGPHEMEDGDTPAVYLS